ncbi:Uncharacterized protein MCB1EB_1480 [Mycoavidus cysteinexigens]|uniref:Uncharacterized protein n=1 Tax=Mycoavidus cysteinexigens TaxID=1553431 RepID=A0A2Z6EW41_9BURK|nr:hypothetical protein [Mycoavidus cysteinexigens]BBE09641.1 Uncharacterized protein MCB1EB_1480 [Mycoavidus cysteinexigens]GAM51608.1 hypothetical protein EBME_0071 [bacterium endosymbiont of Mortierella elongata FMR23-6]GLR01771.1 hypothetical protein GCM10007934_15830 [Mycoavidus cysteinexigens]
MNVNELMHKVEAHYDWLQARSEAADEAYCSLTDEVEENMTFDDLLEAMVDLPDLVKKQALRDAAQAHPTNLLAETYERLLQAQTSKALQRAEEWAYQRRSIA